MLAKLKALGLNRLFKNYNLINLVLVGQSNHISYKFIANSGVPQGSRFGPSLLIIIFKNGVSYSMILYFVYL